MANCSSCNGCSGRGCTRVGALGALCRSGCRNPYYTGPCPAAPCTDNCGNCSANGCCRCRSSAQVNSCTYGGCNNNCNQGCSHCCCRCHGGNHCTCGCHGGSCDHCTCGCHSGDCGGNHCACDDCDDCDDCDGRRGRGYGVFALKGSVRLSAGGAAEFTPCDVNPDYFKCRDGCIIIKRPGLYRAALTVDVPRFTETDTVLSLDLNGKSIPASEIAVDAADCAAAVSYTTDAAFEACAGSKLRLCTSNAMNIDCEDSRNVLRLTLYRI